MGLMRWMRCIVAIASLTLLVAAQSVPNDFAQQGLQLQKSGDFPGAIAAYQRALKADPHRVDVLTDLGVALAHQGQFEQAISAYRKALHFSPDFAPAQINLALAYYKDSYFQQARDLLIAFRKKTPRDLRIDILLADCDLRVGDNAAVIGIMSPWQSSQSQNLALAYLLGTAYIRSGQTEKGEGYIRRIMSYGDRPEVHMMLGDAYSHAHDFKKAASEFAKAIAMNPGLPDAHLRLAETELMTGDSAHAFSDLQAEERLNPNNFEANFYLGVEYKNRGDFANAGKYLERARTMRPDAFAPLLQLGLIAYQQGKYPEARDLLEKVIGKSPDNVQAHVVLGQVYYRLHLRELGMKQREIVQRLNAKRQKASIQQREKVSEHLQPVGGATGDSQP